MEKTADWALFLSAADGDSPCEGGREALLGSPGGGSCPPAHSLYAALSRTPTFPRPGLILAGHREPVPERS